MFDIIEKFNINDPPCNFKIKKYEIVISTLTINILSLALPIMVLQVYDRVMLNQSMGTLQVLAVGVAIAIFLEFILRMARSFTTSWAGMIYEYTLAANAMRCYINSNPVTRQYEGAGKQIQNLGAFQKLRDFYGGQVLVSIVDIPFALVFIAVIMFLTGFLVLVPLALIVIFAIVTWNVGDKLKEALHYQDESDDKRYNFIIESLQGIHSIKSYGIEEVFKRRYERLEEDSTIANYQYSLLSTQGYTLGVIFNEIMVIMVVSFGAPMVIDGNFTTGALITTVLLSGRLMQPIQKMLFLWNQLQDYRIAYGKAEEMFSLLQIDRKEVETEPTARGAISVKDLSFSYDDRELFSGVNIEMKFPEVIALHGQNNAGKSTLMKLIAGILVPSNGQIKINGIESSSYTSEDLVKNVAYISSDNVIYQGTIMENLSAFDELNEEKAMEIARILKIDKEVSLMPQGYDTKISDGIADVVAPGIKQRITMARVLLHKPKVILFDNADKGLDREGYNHLIRLLTLLKGKASMVISTDDHNIKRLADREYLLKDGVLKQVSTNNSSVYDVKPYKELKI